LQYLSIHFIRVTHSVTGYQTGGSDDSKAGQSVLSSLVTLPSAIDYSYFADLEPSPPLRAAIDGLTPSRTSTHLNINNANLTMNNGDTSSTRPAATAARPTLPPPPPPPSIVRQKGNEEFDMVEKPINSNNTNTGRRRRLRPHPSTASTSVTR
jgi:hypothetical protein